MKRKLGEGDRLGLKMKNTGEREHRIYDEFNSERTAKYTVLHRSNLALFINVQTLSSVVRVTREDQIRNVRYLPYNYYRSRYVKFNFFPNRQMSTIFKLFYYSVLLHLSTLYFTRTQNTIKIMRYGTLDPRSSI